MSYADEVLELRNRVRFAAAQSQWDNAAEPEPESDDIASRRLGIEHAREELAKAEQLLDAGNVLMADQAMADAVDWLLPAGEPDFAAINAILAADTKGRVK